MSERPDTLIRPRRRDVWQWAPGLGVLARYRRSWLVADLIAGIVLATILIPQGMAYAELAGLPSITGLYSTIACLTVYALFGPSRVLVLGPESAVAPLILAVIVPLVGLGSPEEAIAIAAVLALLVGLFQVGLGVAKLGFISDLLSREVQVGYMNGLALTIVVAQLPKLFGIPSGSGGVLEQAGDFVARLGDITLAPFALGAATLTTLVLLPLFSRRVPVILVAVVLATGAVAAFDLAAHGVEVVGVLPEGLPTPQLPRVEPSLFLALVGAALGIVMVSVADTIATSTSFAAKRGVESNPNKEIIALGASNLASGLLQGFAVSASGARTAVAVKAGSKSQATGLVGAAVVAILITFAPHLVRNIPKAALAAVVIAAALSLINVAALGMYYQVRRPALFASLATTIGVVVFGVLEGMLLAVLLSILVFFRRLWWQHGTVLARDSATGEWHAETGADMEQVTDVVVFRWEAPLFFANASMFRQEIRKLISREQPRWIVLQCQAITDIDVTAADMLTRLYRELDSIGVQVALVELRARLSRLAMRYGLHDTLDGDRMFGSIEEALATITVEADSPGAPRPQEDA